MPGVAPKTGFILTHRVDVTPDVKIFVKAGTTTPQMPQLGEKCRFLWGVHLNHSDDGWCWPRRHLGCQGAGLCTNHIFNLGESSPKI
jgi:hypothetical protein